MSVLAALTQGADGGGTSVGGGVAMAAAAAAIVLITILARARSRRRAALELVQDTCCGPDQPVVYYGWSGSVHSLYFRNGLYAEAFADANAKKVL